MTTHTPTIYRPWHSNLGDQWATINLLLAKTTQQDEPVLLHSPPKLRAIHQAILRALQIPFPRHAHGGFWFTPDPGTTDLEGYDVWAAPYYPTRNLRWNARQAHTTICYQFDGISIPELKNPPPGELALLLDWIHRSGFEAVRLGLPMTIDEDIQALANAVAFVGVDSGMSHIAHSAGTPCFLLEYQSPVVTTHRGKAYILANSFEDLARHKWPTHVDMLRFIGHPDGDRSTVLRPRKLREALAEGGLRWWLPEEART